MDETRQDAARAAARQPWRAAGPRVGQGGQAARRKDDGVMIETALARARAGGGEAFPDPRAPIRRASSLVVLRLRDNRVSAVTRFGDRGLLARFGLPRTLPRD
jgi:hypothetical protein